ncbi:lytic murein transglycosylase B [Pseudomonas sp. F1_0610]|uniref:lytic murein transglycosylase B n=1 Tax=Pseudomonas sp. F1_0610 TaxID=3114284 RepID=UPI0039C4034C
MFFKKLVFSVILSSCLAFPVIAQNYEQSAAAAAFIQEMEAEHGFIPETLHTVFANAQRQQYILDAISRPAERVKPWKEYRPIFITQQRLDQGLAFWSKNEAALMRAEQEYGVPAEYIVAIIGVETMYGGNTGKHRVIDALSTLAFDYPPRAPFFRKELKEFLILAREEQVNPLELTGSYAGAMGLPQFMPSSFRAYAVDFDGDGHINIWTNPTDAIGSVANYFAKHKWQAGELVTVQAKVAGQNVAKGLSVKIDDKFTVKQLKNLGWAPITALPDNLKVTTFKLEAEQGDEYWLGLNNFQTITRYNRSVMYAMAVHDLAQLMKQARKG